MVDGSDFLEFLISLLIGLTTAFIGSILGLGGGIILVPTLIFVASISDAFAWATPQTIVGISLVVIIFTGLASTLSYLKVKRVDYKTGFLFLLGSIPGGVLGSWLNQFINADRFQLYFGLLIIGIAIILFLKKDVPKEMDLTAKNVRTFELNGEMFHYKVNLYGAVILAFFVGTLSGLFGIGGGSIMVPAMIIFFGFPVHIATSTSMFMIFFTSVSSSITHVALGHIIWEYALFFIPGAWIGGRLGARVNQKLPSNVLEWALRILLMVIGIRMIMQGLG